MNKKRKNKRAPFLVHFVTQRCVRGIPSYNVLIASHSFPTSSSQTSKARSSSTATQKALQGHVNQTTRAYCCAVSPHSSLSKFGISRQLERCSTLVDALLQVCVPKCSTPLDKLSCTSLGWTFKTQSATRSHACHREIAPSDC
jgi:hypothetical protein